MSTWQFNNVAWLYLFTIISSIVIAFRAWKARDVQGGLLFMFLSIATGIWSLSFLLGFFNTDLAWKLIMLRFEYVGILGSGYFWVAFIAYYGNYHFLMNKKFLILLGIVPVLAFYTVLTVDTNHIYYASYGLAKKGDLIIFVKHYGVGFYITMVYLYCLVIGGLLLYLNAVLQMPKQFHKQIIPITITVIIIIFTNIPYVFGNNPFAPYDFTPVSFGAVNIVISFLMNRFGFLDIVPVAYNQVFHNVNSGIIIIDNRNRVLELNSIAEQALEKSSANSIGKQISDVFPQAYELIKDSDSQKEMKEEIQLGKEIRTYSLSISPFNDLSGKSVGRLIILYDITDLKNALNDLNTYAHTVAHDLKSPVSVMLGFTEVLEDEEITKEEKTESIEVLRESLTKMIKIIESLLLLAEVRSETDINAAPLDMGTIIRNSVFRLRNESMEKNATISVQDNWPCVMGQDLWIEEVWVNYLSNAIKYGGTPPQIKLGADIIDGYAKFWIKDNGPGLSDGQQLQIFDEFNRLAYKGAAAGHGLGLSIVKRIIQKLNGEVGVESIEGQGSKFYFILPLQKK